MEVCKHRTAHDGDTEGAEVSWCCPVAYTVAPQTLQFMTTHNGNITHALN